MKLNLKRKTYLKILLWIILSIIFISTFNFLFSIHPPKMGEERNPSQFGLSYEEIWIKTSDGIKLNAWFIPNENTDKTIIVGHGYPFSKDNVVIFAPFLSEKFNLLFLDFRYFGKSEGKITTIGIKETKDIEAVVKYLTEEKGINLEKIGGFGFSFSASIMLMSSNLSAIVAESPFSGLDKMVERSYKIFPGITKKPFIWTTNMLSKIFFGVFPSEISPAESVKDKNIPILLIHGKNDSEIPVENSLKIYENSNKNLTEIWLIEGGGHGQSYYFLGKEYEKRIINFFEKNL